MKKLLCIGLVFVLLLCACQKNKPDETSDTSSAVQTDPTVEPVTTPDITETSEITETTEPERLNLPETYAVITLQKLARYPDIELSIDVPHFGVPALDELLDAYAVEQLQRHVQNPGSLGANGETATYEVKLVTADPVANGKIYSAVFSGSYAIFNEDGDRTDGQELIYTINIDLEEEKILGTADIVSDYAKLSELFRAGKFAESAAASGALDKFRPEYGIYPDVALDRENFCVVISPESFAEKPAVYTLPLAEAAAFLSENYR